MTCLQDETEAISEDRPSVVSSRANPPLEEATVIWEECEPGVPRSLSFPRKSGNLDFLCEIS